MNRARNAIGLTLLAVALAGCSMGSSMLNRDPQPSNVQVNNNLDMPPDLQLPPPGQGAENYQPPVQNSNGNALDAGIATQKPLKKMPVAAAPLPPAAVPQDIFAQNGISKVNADGTQKTPDQLRIELKAALLKKKQQTNPGYGTIRNIGNIFKDQ